MFKDKEEERSRGAAEEHNKASGAGGKVREAEEKPQRNLKNKKVHGRFCAGKGLWVKVKQRRSNRMDLFHRKTRKRKIEK